MSEKRKFVLREQFVWVAWKTFFSPRSTPGGETLIWRSILFWQLGVLCSCCCCLLSRISNPALPAVSCFCECHPVLTVLMVLRYKRWPMNASTNPPFLVLVVWDIGVTSIRSQSCSPYLTLPCHLILRFSMKLRLAQFCPPVKADLLGHKRWRLITRRLRGLLV